MCERDLFETVSSLRRGFVPESSLVNPIQFNIHLVMPKHVPRLDQTLRSARLIPGVQDAQKLLTKSSQSSTRSHFKLPAPFSGLQTQWDQRPGRWHECVRWACGQLMTCFDRAAAVQF